MLLREAMERQGNWLFRWRTVFPLLGGAAAAALALRLDYPTWGRSWDLVWAAGCLLIALSGLALRAATTGYVPRRTSGRNTRKGQVADSLNTKGTYSIVRNPLYVGNFLMALGPLLLLRIPWIAALYACVFFPYYERIIFAEEAFLRRKFGARYEAWGRRTPLWLPRLRQWVAPDRAFDWRYTIRREYQCFCTLLMVFAGAQYFMDYAMDRPLAFDPVWGGLAALSLLTFIVLRLLTKCTRLLHTDPDAFVRPRAAARRAGAAAVLDRAGD